MIRLVLALAALEGLAGVALAAAGAHLGGGSNLATASQMLLLHAAAVLGGAGALHGGLGSARLGAPALALLALGAAVFAGDLALRALKGLVLWRYLAPVGGGAMLLGWGLLALALLAPRGGGSARGGRR